MKAYYPHKWAVLTAIFDLLFLISIIILICFKIEILGFISITSFAIGSYTFVKWLAE